MLRMRRTHHAAMLQDSEQEARAANHQARRWRNPRWRPPLQQTHVRGGSAEQHGGASSSLISGHFIIGPRFCVFGAMNQIGGLIDGPCVKNYNFWSQGKRQHCGSVVMCFMSAAGHVSVCVPRYVWCLSIAGLTLRAYRRTPAYNSVYLLST